MRACEYGVGLVATAIGMRIAGRGREGPGGIMACGPKDKARPARQGHLGSQVWVPDPAVGAGKSADALTREGGEDGTRKSKGSRQRRKWHVRGNRLEQRGLHGP